MPKAEDIMAVLWAAITTEHETPPHASTEYVIFHRKRELIEDEVRALHAHLEAQRGNGSRFEYRLKDGMEKALPFSQENDPEAFFSREKEIFDQHIEKLSLDYIQNISHHMAGKNYDVPRDSKLLLDHLVILRFIYSGLASLSKEVKQVPIATVLCLEWALMQCLLMSTFTCGCIRETVPGSEHIEMMNERRKYQKEIKAHRVAEIFYKTDLDIINLSFHALTKEIRKRLISTLKQKKDPWAREEFLPNGAKWTPDGSSRSRCVPSTDQIGRYLCEDEAIQKILKEKMLI